MIKQQEEENRMRLHSWDRNGISLALVCLQKFCEFGRLYMQQRSYHFITIFEDMQKEIGYSKAPQKQIPGRKGGIGGTYNNRRGGSSTIPASSIIRYCWHLKCTQEKDKSGLIKSVDAFQKEILGNPVLRMYFNEHVLQKLPEHTNAEGSKFRLLGNTVNEAMGIVNTAATSSPRFEDADITGVPIYAVFLDYLQTTQGQNFFAHDQVNKKLKDIFDEYSEEVLKSAKSLSTIDEWLQGSALKYWDPSEYEIQEDKPHMGFQYWNQFFLRSFKKDARPIASHMHKGYDNVISFACESYPLVEPAQPTLNVKKTDQFWLKDNKYSLLDMVDAHDVDVPNLSNLIEKDFEGGTVYQGFLDPWTYHHWHAPVSGTIEYVYQIPGCYYLQNPGISDDTNDDEYINSQPFLSCTSTRQVFIIKADNPHIGRVIVIMIGMAEVSGCVLEERIQCEVNKQKNGEGVKYNIPIKKGDVIGHFEFGGSSHAVIFEKKCQLKFNQSVQDAYFYDLHKKVWSSRRININTELAKALY